MLTRRLVLLPVLGVLVACGGNDAGSVADPHEPRTITVTSPAFHEGGTIPATYTCPGDGVSPPLEWTGVPEDSDLGLVVDDPDAPGGDYIHWIVLRMPAEPGGIAAGYVPDPGMESETSGGSGWTPPCPPSGTHRYRFTIYAFPSRDTWSIDGDPSPREVASFLADHAIAWGRLTGTVSAN